MHQNETLINRFYSAFQQRDYTTMASCYHPEVAFSDSVFQRLSSDEVKAMWKMLLTSAKDLEIVYSNIKANDQSGSAHWEADYTFTSTGRKVHNVIDANFEFKDGKIYRHNDHFNFWKWSKMALG